MINPNIFRAYDIRGSSLKDINATIAYRIGFCFSQMHSDVQGAVTICVGQDGRLSSQSLHDALVQGLVEGGANIISIGVVPSPALYFADKKFNPAASIMITASHNPKDDNGFKMLSGGKSFFGLQIRELLKLIEKTNWRDYSPSQNMMNNAIQYININDEYVGRILDGLTINPKLKVAWDPGNGSGGAITEILKERLPNNNIVINSEIDGNFPNHHPDPTILTNLQQLIDITISENCDVGIGFDGDADRIGIVTNKGRMIYGDQLLCLFAKDLLNLNRDATVIMDIKASQSVFDQIKRYGGNPIMWKTGHPLIKTKMLETNAILGGEMSGHIFFADKYYGYDDGIYAGLRFLDLLSRSDKSLDDMLNTLPKVYNTPEIKISVPEEKKFKIIDEIKKQIKEAGADIIDIDGIRVRSKDGWWLLRASNTSAALVARCESSSEEGLEILKSNLSKILNPFY
jgi:phosphomannomutase